MAGREELEGFVGTRDAPRLEQGQDGFAQSLRPGLLGLDLGLLGLDLGLLGLDLGLLGLRLEILDHSLEATDQISGAE